jgi:hypothetical protein
MWSKMSYYTLAFYPEWSGAEPPVVGDDLGLNTQDRIGLH